MHSVITRKGQVTIPKEIRDHLKAKEGEKVAFVMRGDDVILRMMRGNILDLKGTVKPLKRPQNFEGIRKSVKKAITRRIAREA
jgi:AbrB family looped-hinge helix DNA binding protein